MILDTKKRLGAGCHVAALDSRPSDALDQPERGCRFRQNPPGAPHTNAATPSASILPFPSPGRVVPIPPRRSCSLLPDFSLPRAPTGLRRGACRRPGRPPHRPNAPADFTPRAAGAALSHHTAAGTSYRRREHLQLPNIHVKPCDLPHLFCVAEQQEAGVEILGLFTIGPY
jgi:hypothetical protein